MPPSDIAEPSFRVLIVDDNRDIANTFGMMVGLLGYEFRKAYGGEEALLAADEFEPDCLISDLEMPGIDGYELTRQLRSRPRFSKTPIIAHSARPNFERAKEVGFDACLEKPASPEQVADILEELRAMKRRLEEVELATRQQGEVVGEVRDLMKEVKTDLREMKGGLQQEVKELKTELREVKQDVRELREELSETKRDTSEGDEEKS